MFIPHSFGLALLMMIISAVCWGSWANTYKGVKNYRFELFYWDYMWGIAACALRSRLSSRSSTTTISTIPNISRR